MRTFTGYNLRLKNLLFRQLRYVANKKHRSLNSQITILIEDLINNYEKINGKITDDNLKQNETKKAE